MSSVEATNNRVNQSQINMNIFSLNMFITKLFYLYLKKKKIFT